MRKWRAREAAEARRTVRLRVLAELRDGEDVHVPARVLDSCARGHAAVRQILAAGRRLPEPAVLQPPLHSELPEDAVVGRPGEPRDLHLAP